MATNKTIYFTAVFGPEAFDGRNRFELVGRDEKDNEHRFYAEGNMVRLCGGFIQGHTWTSIRYEPEVGAYRGKIIGINQL